ncbi:hypothetical protein KAW64_03835, partial [bacterium]|nr:hypothetical protein [bacterium]
MSDRETEGAEQNGFPPDGSGLSAVRPDAEEPRGDKPAVDITEGSILKSVLYMGIPSMIGFGAMTIYALTDIYWVGRLGMAHVAALTMFGSIAWI